jgi:HEPN domain-containing protein
MFLKLPAISVLIAGLIIEYKQYDVPKIHSLARLFGIAGEYFSFENYDTINLLDSL